MDIEIRYFDDCPNWRKTRELIDAVAAELGYDVGAVLTVVDTPEKAEDLSFRGSPTVLINGVDPWDNPEAPIGLSCRVYRTETGFAGSPSASQIRAVLTDVLS